MAVYDQDDFELSGFVKAIDEHYSNLKHWCSRPPASGAQVRLPLFLPYGMRRAMQNEIEPTLPLKMFTTCPSSHLLGRKIPHTDVCAFRFQNSSRIFKELYWAGVREQSGLQCIYSECRRGQCCYGDQYAEWLRENGIENITFDCRHHPEVLKARASPQHLRKASPIRFTFGTFDVIRGKRHRV